MHTATPAIDSKLAEALSGKSDQELFGILEDPADWRLEVVEFARSELERRLIPMSQIEKTLTERATRKADEMKARSITPLTFWETVWAAFDGAGLGLLGLLFMWPQASRFKSEGYILKFQRSWRLYWFAFGVRLLAVIVLILW